MGQREGFSKGDLTKINQMYNCPDKTAEITGSKPATGSGAAPSQPNENKENTNPLVNVAQGILGWLFHKK